MLEKKMMLKILSLKINNTKVIKNKLKTLNKIQYNKRLKIISNHKNSNNNSRHYSNNK